MIPSFLKQPVSSLSVLILGLGVYEQGSGIESALFFATRGAHVIITDLRSKEVLKKNIQRLEETGNPRIEYVLGEHRLGDVERVDVIIKNPGVRSNHALLEHARRLKKPIETDLSVFLRFSSLLGFSPFLVAVTGSKGKSSVVSLCAHLLQTVFNSLSGEKLQSPFVSVKKEVALVGNIGKSILTLPLDFQGVVVLELSSWQLGDLPEDLFFSPQVCLITNLYPEHLNTYEHFEAYVEDKKRIFRDLNPSSVFVVNGDDLKILALVDRAKGFLGKLFFVSSTKNIFSLFSSDPAAFSHESILGAAWLEDEKAFWEFYDKPLFQSQANHFLLEDTTEKTLEEGSFKAYQSVSLSFFFSGAFRLNALMAMSLVQIFLKKTGWEEEVKNRIERSSFFWEDAFKSFQAPTFRLERLGEKKRIIFYNDSAATFPQSTLEAIRALRGIYKKERMILLCGGSDKELSFESWEEIKDQVEFWLLSAPSTTATEKIKKVLLGWNRAGKEFPGLLEVFRYLDSTLNVLEGEKTIFLFSPGCTSFGLFQNEVDRGKKFSEEFERFGKETEAQEETNTQGNFLGKEG